MSHKGNDYYIDLAHEEFMAQDFSKKENKEDKEAIWDEIIYDYKTPTPEQVEDYIYNIDRKLYA